jgi:hypothetical protein
VAAAVAVSQRRAIAERLLLAEIRRAGIEEASLSVEAVGFGGLSLADLRLGAPPALEIARIEARYSPGSLWKGTLDELLVSGLRLRASLDDNGFSLGALDALFEGDSGGAGGLPARKIAIADARASVEAPGGAISLPFQGRIDDLGEGRLEGEGNFEVEHPLAIASGLVSIAGAPDDFEGTLRVEGSLREIQDLRIDSVLRADASFRFRGEQLEARAEMDPVTIVVGGDVLRAEGETPQVRVELRWPADGAPFGLGVQTQGGRLDLPDYLVSVAEIELSAQLEERSGAGRLHVRELQHLERPAWVVPLELRGSFDLRGSDAEFRLKLMDAGEDLVIEASGSADPATRSARAQFRLHPIAFEEGDLQPAALFPLLEGQLEEAQGIVEASGTATWDGSRAAAEIDLALREIGFAAEAADFSRLNGRIQISGPLPPITAPGQLISIALIDAGLQLTDGLVEFQLRPDGLLDVREAEWRWAGGVVRTEGRFDPMADSQEFLLEVEGVDLAELLTLVELEGLEGSGTLEGEIPLFRSGEIVEIREAELYGAPEGGRIRYRSAAASQALAGQGYGVEQLLGALDDFHYDVLELTVDGDTRGEVEMAVHLGGFNPNFEGGRRVEFNLNVEAQLADLLRTGRAAYRVPEVIEKRLEKFEEPETR